MIGKILWLLVCVVLGITAGFLQLDREARRKPALADNVPAVFRGFAHEGMTLRALRAEQADASLDHATALVRKRPLPAEHLAMLALAGAAGNRVELSNKAILLSARRGWRAPLAQQVIVASAVDAGQWTTASDRLTALWRSGAEDQTLGLLMSRVLADPRGQTAFSAHVGENPKSIRRFAYWGVRNLPSDAFASTMAQAIQRGGDVDCGDLGYVTERLLNSGAANAAKRIWTGPCATSAETGRSNGPAVSLADMEFLPDDGAGAGPFRWTYPGVSGLKRSWHETDQGWVVGYVNRDPLNAVLAYRFLMLPPDTYRLTAIGKSSGRPAGNNAAIAVWCIDPDGKRRQIASMAETVGFEVPPENCAIQFIRVQVPRGESDGLRLVRG